VLVKDNIDVADLPTTGGSVALAAHVAAADSFVTKKLRDAGAVILGKGTMTEFAGFMSTAMPAGYSSLGGFGFNPFDPRPDPRPAPFDDGRPVLSPGGSSSGPAIAVNASLVAAAVGTDTSGSLLTPAVQNSLVGLRPTLGLVSRSGILPITSDQDTAGPIARSVKDAAIVLGAIAGYDENDPATSACLSPGNCYDDYTPFLHKHALQNARVAVPRFPYWSGLTPAQTAALEGAIAILRDEGAYVDDPHEFGGLPPELAFPPCLAYGQPDCSTVMLYGFKRDLNAYLANADSGDEASSLAAILAFNSAHADVALKYGQTILDAADRMDTSPGSADTLRYEEDRAREVLELRAALDAVYDGPDGITGTDDDFDVVLFPTGRGSNLTARAGYPAITVPVGFVPNITNPPLPADFEAKPAPYGIGLTARAFQEPRLIAIAYAFERATQFRQAPELQ
jgi:amidase